MRCPNCRSEMTVQAETYPYQESGLNVVLLGVTVGRCPNCGESCVEIPNMDGLHECLAKILVKKKGRLSGDEVRFLRTHLGWSGKTFAKKISFKPETVSRWESGVQKIGPQADALLRAFVLLGKKERDYLEPHEDAAPDNVLPFRIRMSDHRWSSEKPTGDDGPSRAVGG